MVKNVVDSLELGPKLTDAYGPKWILGIKAQVRPSSPLQLCINTAKTLMLIISRKRTIGLNPNFSSPTHFRSSSSNFVSFSISISICFALIAKSLVMWCRVFFCIWFLFTSHNQPDCRPTLPLSQMITSFIISVKVGTFLH